MATSWVHRIIVCVPQARYATVFPWWQNQVDGSDDGSTWPTLNASGLLADPETHRVGNTAVTEPLARKIVNQVCAMAGIAMPSLAEWNAWTKPQKYAWLNSTRNELYAQTGIWIDLADNEATWDDPAGILAPLGLRVRHEALP